MNPCDIGHARQLVVYLRNLTKGYEDAAFAASYVERHHGPLADVLEQILEKYDAALSALHTCRRNAEHVNNHLAGRLNLWRAEAFRLHVKTGEPLQETAGVLDDQLREEARAELARVTPGNRTIR